MCAKINDYKIIHMGIENNIEMHRLCKESRLRGHFWQAQLVQKAGFASFTHELRFL